MKPIVIFDEKHTTQFHDGRIINLIADAIIPKGMEDFKNILLMHFQPWNDPYVIIRKYSIESSFRLGIEITNNE